MRRIMEVLRLAAQGLSYRQIGQSVGISASTIQGYLTRAQGAGLSWPLPDDLDGLALEARLFKRGEDEYRPGRPGRIGWRCTVSGRVASMSPSSCCGWSTSGTTLTAGATPSSAPTTTAGLAARTWSCAWSTPRASACLSISAAIRCRSPIPRRARSGTRRCLSCALGASGYLYVEATGEQDLASWLGAHVNALEFYGGSPRVVVPDYVARHIIRASVPNPVMWLGRREALVPNGSPSWRPESSHITQAS